MRETPEHMIVRWNESETHCRLLENHNMRGLCHRSALLEGGLHGVGPAESHWIRLLVMAVAISRAVRGPRAGIGVDLPEEIPSLTMSFRTRQHEHIMCTYLHRPCGPC